MSTAHPFSHHVVESLYSAHHHWLTAGLRRRLGCPQSADVRFDHEQRLIRLVEGETPGESAEFYPLLGDGGAANLRRHRPL